MAIEKELNVRVQNKYDTWENWQKTTTAGQGGLLVLKRGEYGIVEVPTNSTLNQTTPPAIMVKVGDGKTAFKDLPWESALAADVYAWAKKATPNPDDFADVIAKAREGLASSADDYVNTVNGMKGDIVVATGPNNDSRFSYNNDDNHVYFSLELTNTDIEVLGSGVTSAWKSSVDTNLAKKYEKPSDGIPKTDLASAVQTSLGKADAAAPLGISTDAATVMSLYGVKNYAQQSIGDVYNQINEIGGQITDINTDITDLNQGISDNSTKITANTTAIAALQETIKSGITFKGKVTDFPSNPENGWMVIKGTKEYVYVADESGAAGEWVELGDEGTHITKSQADGYYDAKGTAAGLVNALDYTGSGSASKTITSIIQTDGKISATFQDISIPASKVIGLATVAASGKFADLTLPSGGNHYAYAKSNQAITDIRFDADGLSVTTKDISITTSQVSDFSDEVIGVVGGQWNGLDKEGTVTSVAAGTGLKITGTASTTPTVEFDDSVVFVLNGGTSTTVI